MTLSSFHALCLELTVPTSLALEIDEVREALAARKSTDELREIITRHF